MLASVNQLADSLTWIRLGLHVTAATVWVGGQLVMAGLVPAARKISPEAPRALAATFGRISWPAYWLLVATGLWNWAAVTGGSTSGAWMAVFVVKLVAVVAAGVFAWRHTRATSAAARGAFAGTAALASLLALALGVGLGG